MAKNILLVEPDYNNKYPPLGLMKISTYHKLLKDNVRFFKGNFNDFIKANIYFDTVRKLYAIDTQVAWVNYRTDIKKIIFHGVKNNLPIFNNTNSNSYDFLMNTRINYRNKTYLDTIKFDRIYIATLFTFYWDKTINAINDFKRLCVSQDEVKVGGVAATLLPDQIFEDTGIKPHIGLLNKAGIYDKNKIIIDELPLDYSILYETDYQYADKSAYYFYTTRGCVNKCKFCAVPKLEPSYIDYVAIKRNIEITDHQFGKKKNLLLLDNNVFASKKFATIIDEIKEMGFAKGSFFENGNPYELAYKGLVSGYNDNGYKNHIWKIYIEILAYLETKKLFDDKTRFYSLLQNAELLHYETISKEKIIANHTVIMQLSSYIYKKSRSIRKVDFNQGVDARLATEDKIRKLAEICISPLRIAFDEWKYKKIYAQAIKLSKKYGITNLSNYLLYNYNDKPEELYKRIKFNIELCNDLDIRIFSFPMKYHPINDVKYFKNRSYVGKHWNKKFIRAIQAILNATKGKIGRGKSFFEEAFGRSVDEFKKLLYMPEAMIVYRMHFKENGQAKKWADSFDALSNHKREALKSIVAMNDFHNLKSLTDDKEILKVLKYYTIKKP